MRTVRDRYDVIVVGSRVAGAVTAALVAERGHSVLLVDRGHPSTETISTHFFRGARLVSVPQKLGVLDEILLAGSPRLTRQFTYTSDQPLGIEQPPQEPGDIGFALSVRRQTLDPVLMERARRAGAEIRTGWWVKELLFENGRVGAMVAQTPEGLSQARSRLVVGADGRHSFIAESVNAKQEESTPPTRGLYYCYVTGWTSPEGGISDAAEFSFLPGEIAYVFPSDKGQTCLALSLNREDCSWLKKAASKRFVERIMRHTGLAGRFLDAGNRSRIFGGSPEPNYVRVPWGAGWALVGDSSIHSDPFAGVGMDMAGMHATYLAEAINSWLEDSCSEEDAFGQYHQRRNEDALEIYRDVVETAQQL